MKKNVVPFRYAAIPAAMAPGSWVLWNVARAAEIAAGRVLVRKASRRLSTIAWTSACVRPEPVPGGPLTSVSHRPTAS